MLLAEEIGTGGWIGIIGATSTAIGAAAGYAGKLIGQWQEKKKQDRIDTLTDFKNLYDLRGAELEKLKLDSATEIGALKAEIVQVKGEAEAEIAKVKMEAEAEVAKVKADAHKETHDQRDYFNQELLALHKQLALQGKAHQDQRNEDNSKCDQKIDELMKDNLQHERDKAVMMAAIARLEVQIKYLDKTPMSQPDAQTAPT